MQLKTSAGVLGIL